MNNQNMMCDLETGVCGISENDEMEMIDFNEPTKTIKLYYVTDPICSHCWAIEPVLGRFIEQYGDYFNVIPVMGGLLEIWHDGPIDPVNGIYKPSDVTVHWREVGKLSRMPIDGSLMIDNPVQSSYPPSRVFKIIQKDYDTQLAMEFLRRTREALFVFNQNISEKSVLIDIVNNLGLDGLSIVNESEQPIGQQLLNEDFQLVRKLGARGFPTIIMMNEENKGIRIVGSRPLDVYIQSLKQVLNQDEIHAKPLPSLANLLQRRKLLFAKEIEVMYDIIPKDLLTFVNNELEGHPYKEYNILGEYYFTVY